jgi:cell division protein FtsZ
MALLINLGALTVGVVTKPFNFEGKHRQQVAEEGINELRDNVDTLILSLTNVFWK